METSLPNHFALIGMLVYASIGLAVAMLAWLVSRALAEVPPDDRTYKAPPPLGFRLAWWPISWVSHFLQPLLPAARQGATSGKLRNAGLEYCVSPAQFEASRVVAAAVCVAIAAWLMSSFAAAKGWSGSSYFNVLLCAALMGWIYPVIWLNDRLNVRKKELLRSLPFYLDIITLCVEAGLYMQGAINQAVR